MEKCIGIIGILNKMPKETSVALNALITEYRDIVTGRLGVPKHEPDLGIIALIVEGDTDKIYALEKKLKEIDGMAVNMTLSVC